MFDELKNLAVQKLERADPRAVSDAVRSEIGDLPPAEVAQHSQAAISNLQQTNPDLAKELEDLVKAGQVNPDALKSAVMSFIEAHPETLTQFAPKLAEGILSRL